MKLAEKNLCTGCGACAAICPKHCIHMEQDAAGFPHPAAKNKECVSCNLCESVCPVMNVLQQHGDSPVAYAAYSRDEAMRAESSSGGIFSELARPVLAKGGAVFGSAYNEQFDVVHICAEDETTLASLRGAKYAQSDLGNTFSQVKHRLETGQDVLFSGTSCQVAGLQSFLGKPYDNLLCIDFVCHGVPSPMAWKQYVQYCAEKDNGGIPPLSINLRAKETGWSRYQYSNVFEYASGKRKVTLSNDSLFMKLFVGNCISRLCCEQCRFRGYSRFSDLTLGDFWGIWDIHPSMDDNKGTSVVLVQSKKGMDHFDQIGARCVVRQVSLEQASAQNQSMLRSSLNHAKRQDALSAIRQGNFEKCEALLVPAQRSRSKKLLRKLKSFLAQQRLNPE